MTLYLVHHADAVVAALDATRPLSAHGREQAADVSARVAAHGAMPESTRDGRDLLARRQPRRADVCCTRLAAGRRPGVAR